MKVYCTCIFVLDISYSCLQLLCFAGVYAFVTLKDKVTEKNADILIQLRKLVRNQLAAYAVPEKIQVKYMSVCCRFRYSELNYQKSY